MEIEIIQGVLEDSTIRPRLNVVLRVLNALRSGEALYLGNQELREILRETEGEGVEILIAREIQGRVLARIQDLISPRVLVDYSTDNFGTSFYIRDGFDSYDTLIK